MFHGNAGNIGHRVPIAKILSENSGCSVLMLEYRGYGMSTGTPNQEGLMIDAQTGLDWIRNGKGTKGNRIIVYGQSLGGAVAIQLVEKNQEASDVVGLILENTFTSIRKLIPRFVKPARCNRLMAEIQKRLPSGEVYSVAVSSILGKRGNPSKDYERPYFVYQWSER